MNTYRQEIMEAQKTRSDLLKYKLVLCAVLGSIGLGLKGVLAKDNLTNGLLNNRIYLTLLLIPFVCAYVDLLCYHLNLRMLVIAKFLKDPRRQIIKNDSNSDISNQELENYRLYEKICEEERDAFNLESFALKTSSIVLSFLLIILFILPLLFSPCINEIDRQGTVLLVFSGIIGIIIAMLIEYQFSKKYNLLNLYEQKLNKFAFDFYTNLENINSIYYRTKITNFLYIFSIWIIIIFDFAMYFYVSFQDVFITIRKSLVLITPITLFLFICFCLLCQQFNLIKKYSKKLQEEFKNQEPTFKCYNFLLSKKVEKNYNNYNSFYYFIKLLPSLLMELVNNQPIEKDNSKNNNQSADYQNAFFIEELENNLKTTISFWILIAGINILTCFLAIFNLSDSDKVFAIVGVLEILVFTLFFPYLHTCLNDNLNRLSSLKSFLPKEIGQIQEHFIAQISQNSNNNEPITFRVYESNEKNNKNTYLHLIKCSKGIVIVNPEGEFITPNDTKIIVKQGQNALNTGKYWEISFDFSINIAKNGKNEQNEDIYYFDHWKKINSSDNQDLGLEVGEKTALYFIYID